ncbi:hypothetical protein [Bradyrhizobium sp.]|uniref:hypothetical protein n=1 Tax=Bradyrhizobium sp. TaxID=376 RepID=UPI002E0499EB|nr:hypothetical protein [Bradyrhizobium sp.]
MTLGKGLLPSGPRDPAAWLPMLVIGTVAGALLALDNALDLDLPRCSIRSGKPASRSGWRWPSSGLRRDGEGRLQWRDGNFSTCIRGFDPFARSNTWAKFVFLLPVART